MEPIGSLAMGLMWGWLAVLVLFRNGHGGIVAGLTAAGLASAVVCLQWLALSGPPAVVVFLASAAGSGVLHLTWRAELRLRSADPTREGRSSHG